MIHAGHFVDVAELRASVARRLPARLLQWISTLEGVDADDPIVRHLVSSGVLGNLVTHGDCCPLWRPLAMGGQLHVQERIG